MTAILRTRARSLRLACTRRGFAGVPRRRDRRRPFAARPRPRGLADVPLASSGASTRDRRRRRGGSTGSSRASRRRPRRRQRLDAARGASCRQSLATASVLFAAFGEVLGTAAASRASFRASSAARRRGRPRDELDAPARRRRRGRPRRRARPADDGHAARRGRRRVRRLLPRPRSRACTPHSPSTGASSTRSGAERTLAVATSAVRDAANGAEFLRGVESGVRLRRPGC